MGSRVPPSPTEVQGSQVQNALSRSQDLSLAPMMSTCPPMQRFVPPPQSYLANLPSNMRSAIMISAMAKNEVLASIVTPRTKAPETLSSVCQTTAPLSEEGDRDHLNPLHCFVRQHVEIFTADEKDVAAPAPGRKTPVILGQVGIRCKHCTKLPIKERVKRAICYPPSVEGIYHSVSNMKFDHFGKCRGKFRCIQGYS